MSHGVRVFRVDNPHTKPVDFWAWLLGEVRRTDPDVLFLAEAFTKPAMMHMLGKVGFQQCYTYFTWRNEKWEIERVPDRADHRDRQLLPAELLRQHPRHPALSSCSAGGPAAFTIRAVLAATLSPLWGVYSGYELFENAALAPGREEYLDSEKFQYRPRDWEAADECGENLNLLLGRLNQIRREHPALQQLRDLHFHHAPHSNVLVFSKRPVTATPRRDGDDVVIVVASLDPHNVVETEIVLDMEALGLTSRDVYLVHDELTGQTWRWGQHAFVRLTHDDPCHILTLVRYGARHRGPLTGPLTALLPRRPTRADLMRVVTGARWFAGKGRRAELRSFTPLLADRARPVAGARRSGRDRRGQLSRTSAGAPARSYYQLAGSLPPAAAGAAPWPHAELLRTTDPDLGAVVAYDAAQDPAGLPGAAGRAARRPPGRATRTASVRFHLRPTPTAARRPRAAGVPRPAEQHLGHVRRRGDAQAVPPARARAQSRHRGARRAERRRRRRRRPAVRLGRGAPGGTGGRTCSAPTSPCGGEAGRRRPTAGTSRWSRCADGRPFADEAEPLGRALAEIHAALRDAFPTARSPARDVAAVMTRAARRGRGDRAGARRRTSPGSGPASRALAAHRPGRPAGARRLPPRPDAAHAVGLEDHRLRGRAGQDPRRAGRPGQRLARHRRDAALVRLRRAPACPVRTAAAWATDCRAAFLDGYTGGALSAGGRRAAARRTRRTRRSTRSSTRCATGRTGCHPARRGRGARRHDRDPTTLADHDQPTG